VARVGSAFHMLDRVNKWSAWLDSPTVAATISFMWLGGGVAPLLIDGANHSFVWWVALVVQWAAVPFIGLLVRGAAARKAAKAFRGLNE